MNPRYRRLLIPGLLLTLLVVVLVSSLARRADSAEPSSTPASRISDPRITESSGLALSREQDDLGYTINDSGNEPIVYAIRISTGAVVGTTRIEGGDLLDTEAIAIDPDGTLWVADTGDNLSRRNDAALYALPEPGVGSRYVTAKRYPITYDSGPVDVEALLINPRTGVKLLASKEVLGGRVFSLDTDLVAGRTNTAKAVDGASTPLLVTDGAFTTDGSNVVLRTYTATAVYDPASWELVGSQDLPRQQQGESMAMEPSGDSLLIGSEGVDSALLRVRLAPIKDAPPAQPPASPSPTSTAAVADDFDPPGSSGFAGFTFVYAGIAVVGLITLFAVLSRRRH